MKILIVIPCYHEEEVLPLTMEKMREVIRRLKDELQVEGRILFPLVRYGGEHRQM